MGTGGGHKKSKNMQIVENFVQLLRKKNLDRENQELKRNSFR